jgi:hypothetical protein
MSDVAIQQMLQFSIDTAFEVAETPVSFRMQKGAFNLALANTESSKYLSSQYLANSSLSQDVSGAFFADGGARGGAFAAAAAPPDEKDVAGASLMEDEEEVWQPLLSVCLLPLSDGAFPLLQRMSALGQGRTQGREERCEKR